MKPWMLVLIGWLIGSFFGLSALLSMFKGKTASAS
jgi:hypothetical protein